jgi:hypothetical protein
MHALRRQRFSPCSQLLPSPGLRSLSSTATNEWLTRDFIHQSLYGVGQRDATSREGYFNRRDCISTPPSFLNFNGMLGKAEYRTCLAKLYDAQEHAWLTPVEIFAPWYSAAIARYAVSRHLAAAPATASATGPAGTAAPLVIYEVGGGNGTNALHVLNFIREYFPHIYLRTEYRILEVSARLHERQLQVLHGAGHGKVVRGTGKAVGGSVLADATDLAAALHDPRPALVIALEVLDNLPHDKVLLVEEAGAEAGAGAARGPEPAGAASGALRSGAQRVWLQTAVRDCTSSPTADSDSRAERHRPEAHPDDPAPSSHRSRRCYKEVAGPISDECTAALLPLIRDKHAHWEAQRSGGLFSRMLQLAGLRRKQHASASAAAEELGRLRRLVSSPEQAEALQQEALQLMAYPPASIGRLPLRGNLNGTGDSSTTGEFAPSHQQQRRLLYARYVPTGCLQLLRSLRRTFPRHSLLMADFTVLPSPAVTSDPLEVAQEQVVEGYTPAACSPLVASKNASTRKTVDHPTYMSPRAGTADIFFPTDFELLARMVAAVRSEADALRSIEGRTTFATPVTSSDENISTSGGADHVRTPSAGAGVSVPQRQAAGSSSGRAVQVLASSEFLRTWGEVARTATLTGYNPMLEDYPNTRFILA